MKTFVNLAGAQFLGPAVSPGAIYLASVDGGSTDILCIKGNVYSSRYTAVFVTYSIITVILYYGAICFYAIFLLCCIFQAQIQL